MFIKWHEYIQKFSIRRGVMCFVFFISWDVHSRHALIWGTYWVQIHVLLGKWRRLIGMKKHNLTKNIAKGKAYEEKVYGHESKEGT